MTDGGGNNTGVLTREYRKGNWTVGETMVLIEAKKMDEERRMKRVSESEGGGRRSKPTELRWKWVEDYCWRKDCLRSQNQCNDKWDNLMRDYKKVREYERSRRRRRSTGERSPSSCEEGGSGGGGGGSSDQVSYWNLEKNERKERNLPTNMLPQIYEALVEVVESRSGSTSQRMLDIGGGGGGSGPNPYVSDVVVVERPISAGVVHHLQQSSPLLMPPLLQPHHQLVVSPPPVAAVLPLPPPQPQPPPPPPPPYSQPQFPTLDSDTSEHSDSTAKRRRRSSSGRGGGGEGTSGGGGGSASQSHDDDGNDEKVGTAISKSASIIAEAIQASEEREERRHRDLLSLQERRLKIEESKAEINRQGISGLVDAVNKLANSVLALASHNNTPQ